MRKKAADNRSPPVAAIYPEGGPALYEEPGTGIRLTGQDYAAKYGYENEQAVEKAYRKEVDTDGRRTTEPDINPDSPAI